MSNGVQRALVTGADGFLGRHLVRELERHGTSVTRLARRAGPDGRSIEMGDAPWPVDSLARIIDAAEPEAVFHLAGVAVGEAAEIEQVNLGLARAVMDALRRTRARPVLVCCGSAAEYGSAHVDGEPTPESAVCVPLGAYGASKLAQTREALAFGERSGVRVLVARIFNPIGPGMPQHLALGEFARQLASLPPQGGTLRTGTLDVARDFIDVDLVARALRLLAQHPDARGVVNICSGRATRLADLVDMLIAASGKKVDVEIAPERVRPGEIRAVFGDPGLLWRLVGRLEDTDGPAVTARIWREAAARVVGEAPCAA